MFHPGLTFSHADVAQISLIKHRVPKPTCWPRLRILALEMQCSTAFSQVLRIQVASFLSLLNLDAANGFVFTLL